MLKLPADETFGICPNCKREMSYNLETGVMFCDKCLFTIQI